MEENGERGKINFESAVDDSVEEGRGKRSAWEEKRRQFFDL